MLFALRIYNRNRNIRTRVAGQLSMEKTGSAVEDGIGSRLNTLLQQR